MDDHYEYQLRRQAIRLWLTGTPGQVILRRVRRSRAWLSKWCQRFDQAGWRGLKSQPRRPHHTPSACAPRLVRLILQTRRRLVKQKVGLIGPRAIQRELHQLGLGQRVPSLSTIKRILRAAGLVRTTVPPPSAYFPKPLLSVVGVLHALDWTCRYLTDGPKVYAFHTLNLHTRACYQTIASNKNGRTLLTHILATWKTLGIPDFLQLDNDALFCGGYKTPRRFGQFTRLCLYVGIELIFLPVAEPECNGEIESLNGLWGRTFWERRRFGSFAHVQRASPAFLRWYLTTYTPPYLADQSPAEAQRTEPRSRLTARQQAALPDPLPITAGHIHFIRKVLPDGTISILNENWKVSKRLAGHYVWATVTTHCRRLDIWYQRSPQQDWRLLTVLDYDIPETVARLKPEFVHPRVH